MRILRIHNRYQERGGEDVCFEAEVDLLRAHGDEVQVVIVSNDVIRADRSPLTSARLAASTVWSREGRRRVGAAIEAHRPDVAHFDNTFPLISPAAYLACRERGVAVVQTLHNYRPLCPGAAFYRDGRPCEDCLGKLVALPGIVHGCYRESRSQTAVVAAMNAFHQLRGTWRHDVDRYIAMTRFERDKFIAGGFPADRIVIKPHFVDPPAPPPQGDRRGLLYVGRLADGKGVPALLEAWQQEPHMPLTIVGDGPLSEQVAAIAARRPALHYLGRRSGGEIARLMGQAELLVSPSRFYETFGRVAIEAFAQGTPVLASRHGAIGEVVADGRTGLHFDPAVAGDLAAKLRWAAEHPAELRRMGDAARVAYAASYTPERNYQLLMAIYRDAIAAARSRTASPRPQHTVLDREGLT